MSLRRNSENSVTIKGKRAKITPDGLTQIMTRALEHPHIQRTKLAEQLQSELQAMGEDVPEIEVLERKISWFRNNMPDNPLDKPWSMGTLLEVRFNLPPDTLPAVFEVQEYRLKEGKDPLTIRQAQWVARLSSVIAQTRAFPRGQVLDFWAERYTASERFYAWLQSRRRTSKLDTFMKDTSKDDARVRRHAEAYCAATSWVWEDIEEAEGYEAAVSYGEGAVKLRAIWNEIKALHDRLDTTPEIELRSLLDRIRVKHSEYEALFDIKESRFRRVEERLLAEGRELSAKHPDFKERFSRFEASILERSKGGTT